MLRIDLGLPWCGHKSLLLPQPRYFTAGNASPASPFSMFVLSLSFSPKLSVTVISSEKLYSLFCIKGLAIRRNATIPWNFLFRQWACQHTRVLSDNSDFGHRMKWWDDWLIDSIRVSIRGLIGAEGDMAWRLKQNFEDQKVENGEGMASPANGCRGDTQIC